MTTETTLEKYEKWIDSHRDCNFYLVQDGLVCVDGYVSFKAIALIILYWLTWRIMKHA